MTLWIITCLTLGIIIAITLGKKTIEREINNEKLCEEFYKERK